MINTTTADATASVPGAAPASVAIHDPSGGEPLLLSEDMTPEQLTLGLLLSLSDVNHVLGRCRAVADRLGLTICADTIVRMSFLVGSAMRSAHPGAQPPVEEETLAPEHRNAARVVSALDAALEMSGLVQFDDDRIGAAGVQAAMDWAMSRGDRVRVEVVAAADGTPITRFRRRSDKQPHNYWFVVGTILHVKRIRVPLRTVEPAGGDVSQIGGAT